MTLEATKNWPESILEGLPGRMEHSLPCFTRLASCRFRRSGKGKGSALYLAVRTHIGRSYENQGHRNNSFQDAPLSMDAAQGGFETESILEESRQFRRRYRGKDLTFQPKYWLPILKLIGMFSRYKTLYSNLQEEQI
jgi:hypothetical protein